MTSARQIEANRRNAANSTGPRTVRGKAVVALNAVQHGLLSRQAVIRSENEAELVDFGKMEEHDRLWHRMEKIARRLGDRDPLPEIPPRRPKWMRTATYDRLLEAWHDAGERRDEIYDAKIAGCIARLGRLGG